MLRESHTAIVARNELWAGESSSEPYEAGWAREVVIFLRALSADNIGADDEAVVQISPDGMNWVDEGTTLALPREKDQVTFARVSFFGNWLRVASKLADGKQLKVVMTFSLK